MAFSAREFQKLVLPKTSASRTLDWAEAEILQPKEDLLKGQSEKESKMDKMKLEAQVQSK